jgi:hypothetical protein
VRVENIRPDLSESVQSLLDDYCLHDARVLAFGRSKRQFSILLRLDTPRSAGLFLTYELVSGPVAIAHPKLAASGKPWEWVLYDEIDHVRTKKTGPYSHAILFTGGKELQLSFSDVKLTRYEPILSPLMVKSNDNGDEDEPLAVSQITADNGAL